MIETLRAKLDYFLYRYFYRIPFLSYELTFKFDFPTKRLVRYCMKNKTTSFVSKTDCIAHMYAYDATCTKENLDFLHQLYHTHTRERVRQILAKFVRMNYK